MKTNEYGFSQFLSIAIKWRKLIVLNLIVVLATAVIISLVLPKWYTSQISLLPPENQGMDSFSVMSMISSDLPSNFSKLTNFKTAADLYVAIIKSRNVREGVIRKMDLIQVYKAINIEEALEKLNDLTFVDRSEEQIISIKVTDRSAIRAAQIAQTYVEELDRVNRMSRVTTARQTREFIEKRLAETHEELIRTAENLRDFQKQHKAISVEEQTKAVIETAAQLRAQIALTEMRLNIIRQSFQETHSQVKMLKSELEEMNQQLEKVETGAQLDHNDYLLPFSAIPELGMQLAFLVKDLETQKAIYKLLVQQYEQSKIQEARDTPTIQVLDKAVPPLKKSRPKRALIVLISGLLSILMSGFFVFSSEYVEQIREQKTEDYYRLKKVKDTLWSDWLNVKRAVFRR
jgi:uncharacterized protein involved in exopolysaccharide biosynthesis